MFVRETTRIRPIHDFYDGNKRVNLIYIVNNLPKNKRIDIKYHKILDGIYVPIKKRTKKRRRRGRHYLHTTTPVYKESTLMT